MKKRSTKPITASNNPSNQGKSKRSTLDNKKHAYFTCAADEVIMLTDSGQRADSRVCLMLSSAKMTIRPKPTTVAFARARRAKPRTVVTFAKIKSKNPVRPQISGRQLRYTSAYAPGGFNSCGDQNQNASKQAPCVVPSYLVGTSSYPTLLSSSWSPKTWPGAPRVSASIPAVEPFTAAVL